jgi:hypothetical protein
VNRKLIFFSSLVFYRALLDIFYALYVHEVFSYQGFLLNLEPLQYFFSWVACCIFFILLRCRPISINDYFYFVVVLSFLVPITSVYGLDDSRSLSPIIYSTASILIVKSIEKIQFPSLRVHFIRRGEMYAIILSSIFVISHVFWYLTNREQLNLHLDKIYAYREMLSTNYKNWFVGYTGVWTYKVFNILLIALSLLRKKYLLFLMLLVVQLFFFSVTGHKAILLLPFIVFGCWIYFQKPRAGILFVNIFSLAILIGLFLFIFIENSFFANIILKRVFFSPVNVHFVELNIQ